MADLSEQTALGVIAGQGALPRMIAEDRRARGAPYLVCGFEGTAPDWIGEHPHVRTRFEKPGALFRALREAGVEQVVFAGAMSRPSLNPLRFDSYAARIAKTVMPLLRQGDDALLRGLAEVFESEGFRLIGAEEALGGLLAPAGSFSEAQPGAEDRADIDRAAELANAIGAVDAGQAAVVVRGVCLGLESIQGTDALLRFAAATPSERRPVEGRAGAVFKAPKPGQDGRLDLPAIGPDTVRLADEAGLAGVGVAAGGALVLDMKATRAEADRRGLFLWGREGGA